MSTTIEYDGTTISNGTYIPRFIRHESVPNREVVLLNLAREDGAVFVSDKYNAKYITVVGHIKAGSQSALESQIDTFKELFNRKLKNLDISWAGGTRRYKAICTSHEFMRDYYNMNFCPYQAEFIIPDGIGVDETSYEECYSGTPDDDYDSEDFTISNGTAKPKPYYIRINFYASDVTGKGKMGWAFESGGKKLIYTSSSNLIDGDKFLINCRDKTVSKWDNSSSVWDEVVFHGEFPEFIVGSNSFDWTFGEILQETHGFYNDGILSHGGNGKSIYGTNYQAQSFMLPWKDESIRCISANIQDNGSPSDLVLRIETDDGGAPSGTLADANATVTTAVASIPGLPYFRYYFSNAVTLEGNTKYWLVAKQDSDGGDSSNHYNWIASSSGSYVYTKGHRASSTDSGSTWTDTIDEGLNFAIYIGGKRTSDSSANIQIRHYPRYL